MDDWTAEDLRRLKLAASEGSSAERIAAELGRSQADVEDRLALLGPADSGNRRPEPSFGPDEEGDVTPIIRGDPQDDDAWVHARKD